MFCVNLLGTGSVLSTKKATHSKVSGAPTEMPWMWPGNVAETRNQKPDCFLACLVSSSCFSLPPSSWSWFQLFFGYKIEKKGNERILFHLKKFSLPALTIQCLKRSKINPQLIWMQHSSSVSTKMLAKSPRSLEDRRSTICNDSSPGEVHPVSSNTTSRSSSGANLTSSQAAAAGPHPKSGPWASPRRWEMVIKQYSFM